MPDSRAEGFEYSASNYLGRVTDIDEGFVLNPNLQHLVQALQRM